MTVEVSNCNLDYVKETQELGKLARKEMVIKSFLAATLCIAGFAAAFFIGGHLLTVGVGIILISSTFIYQYYNCYRDSATIFITNLRSSPETLSQKPEGAPL